MILKLSAVEARSPSLSLYCSVSHSVCMQPAPFQQSLCLYVASTIPTVTQSVCSQYHSKCHSVCMQSAPFQQSLSLYAASTIPTITQSVCSQHHSNNHSVCMQPAPLQLQGNLSGLGNETQHEILLSAKFQIRRLHLPEILNWSGQKVHALHKYEFSRFPKSRALFTSWVNW